MSTQASAGLEQCQSTRSAARLIRRLKLLNFFLLVALLVAYIPPGTVAIVEADAGSPRVNVWASTGTINWANAPIFWFGRATLRNNYVDVRVGYNSQTLQVFATIVDYDLWYDPSGGSDPRQYDSLVLQLDTGNSNSASPQPTSYLFVSGFRWWETTNLGRWQRQARGNGGTWDYAWSPSTTWTDQIGYRWNQSGPNNNSDLDAGWTTTLTIPWSTIGLSGPPADGQTWKLGVQVYDRDEAPGGADVTSNGWPNSLDNLLPASWGRLVFSPPPFQGPDVPVTGTTVIRRGLSGAVVSDAYVGGGGLCGGGVFGGGDQPHPTDNLFVQNQEDVADFPCFSKSYLKFDLSPLPAGVTITSAKLLVYEFGGSDPTRARPSLVRMFTVDQDWDEQTLTWNNAPMAHENVSSTVVPVVQEFTGWPGVPNYWDATQAVTEAHAAGKPLNIVLYSADTEYHSGKYFTSSETGEWNAAGRPTVTIEWATSLTERAFVPIVIK